MKKLNLGSRGRVIGLVLGVVLVLFAIYWVITSHSSSPSSGAGDQSNISAPGTGNPQGGPGSDLTPEQKKLQDKANKQQCENDPTCLQSGATQ